MSDLQAIADHVEIEALRGEFTDAVMMRDYNRVASLFTPDGVWRMPKIPAELTGQEEIRAWGERVPDFVDYLVQLAHGERVHIGARDAAVFERGDQHLRVSGTGRQRVHRVGLVVRREGLVRGENLVRRLLVRHRPDRQPNLPVVRSDQVQRQILKMRGEVGPRSRGFPRLQ